MQRIILLSIVIGSMLVGFLIGGAVTAVEFDGKYRALMKEYQVYFSE